jgi:hypothetical protein
MAKKPVATDEAVDGVQMILVRATAKGYFGRVIEPDQGEASEFYVPEGTTGSWFEPVKASKKADDGDVI